MRTRDYLVKRYDRSYVNHILNAAATPTPLSVNAVVFTYRESSSEVLQTINAILENSGRAVATLDILVNGNFELAIQLRQMVSKNELDTQSQTVRVWSSSVRGKDFSWNTYVHTIWDGRSDVFFFDGYSHPLRNAIFEAQRLTRFHPDACAVSGVPSGSRTAESLQREILGEGGLCGGMFMLTADTLHRIRYSDFHLPVGLYGFDTVLGAILGFGLHPQQRCWDVKRYVLSSETVGFEIHVNPLQKGRNITQVAKRQIKSGLRRLVSGSTRHYFERMRLPIDLVPKTLGAYISEWAKMQPREFLGIALRNPWCIFPLFRAVLRTNRPKRFEQFVRFI
jgi:hypothetical protein